MTDPTNAKAKHFDGVLVVGAGPSGLILTYELMRRGVPVRLVEKRQGPSHTARAMTVHARSMEMFDHMSIGHRLKEVCLECPGNRYHFPGMPDEQCPKTDYRVLPTRYPFYYKISQNDFEQVLREHLLATQGMAPEYQTEIVALSSPAEIEKDGLVKATIKLPNGQTEVITCPWVIGCDGVKSFVRDVAGIKFNGEVVAAMAMMDVPLTSVNFDDRWMNYYFTKDLFMNVTRMPGGVWRIYMSEPTGEYVYREDKKQSFQEVADKIGIGFKLGEPEWATSWDIRNNIASHYREGRLIICGDASHVHSPSGGQGMNGCMQDAFNLGWKLAAVYKGQGRAEILDTYEKERKPIGEQISHGAMATHHIVMGFGEEPGDRYHLTQVPNWEDTTIKLVSGLSHNYCKVVRVPDGLRPTKGPRAGERAPDALLTKSPLRHLYDIFRRPQFTLLVCPSKLRKNEHLAHAVTIRDTLEKRFPNCVCIYLISDKREAEFDFDHQSNDETGEFLERYEIDQNDDGRLVLVRPDLYVAMSCCMSEWEAVSEYLEQWYVPVVANGDARTSNQV
ncbi:pentachlorophenol monooxygenase [Exophiala viscosa]|uniref:pentachlorophenol monooxygenase n=1 Tax=Exophiala viscosa TaxID=2486360 RepID=UPI00219949AE|nr:pentachlorophenol monooxygenase [Exophiala viscosa]